MASITTASGRPVPRVGFRATIQHWQTVHPFIAYVIRRLAIYVFTLWAAISVTFVFFHLIPGDPIEAFITSLQQQYVYNVTASQAVVQHYKELFGLNGSLWDQYVSFMGRTFINHNFGPALLDFPTPATVIVTRALPWTIGLLGFSAIISFVIGMLLGALIGWTRGSRVSDWATNFSLAFSHVPFYLVALMFIFFFAYQLALFPASQAYAASIAPAFNWAFIKSVVQHGFLPSLSIVFIGVCNWIIGTRMLMVTTLGEDYLTFADAKGLKPNHILTQYAMRNCYLPQIVAFGIGLGYIFNGNVLVEELFNYPGVGNLFVQAIGILDYDTIQCIIVLVIFAVLTANLIIDLMLPFLDPRVKYWK